MKSVVIVSLPAKITSSIGDARKKRKMSGRGIAQVSQFRVTKRRLRKAPAKFRTHYIRPLESYTRSLDFQRLTTSGVRGRSVSIIVIIHLGLFPVLPGPRFTALHVGWGRARRKNDNNDNHDNKESVNREAEVTAEFCFSFHAICGTFY